MLLCVPSPPLSPKNDGKHDAVILEEVFKYEKNTPDGILHKFRLTSGKVVLLLPACNH